MICYMALMKNSGYANRCPGIIGTACERLPGQITTAWNGANFEG